MIVSVCPNPSIDTYAWMASFQAGKVNRIEEIQAFPGGKGTHVAMALNELNADVALYGIWAGAAGAWIKKHSNTTVLGIDIQGENRKCYTFRSDDHRFNHSELLEPGPSFSAGDWQKLKADFEKQIETSSLITLSGSWPKGAPKDAYKQLIHLAQEKNKKVILDGSGEQLENALQTNFYGLHLNEHEAEALCGSKNIEDVLAFLDGKVTLVALSLGEKGLHLAIHGNVYHACYKVENVISTIGSGDCLTAGIAYAVTENLFPEDIARYGVACGAANCMYEALGMLQKKDVDEIVPKVQLNQLKK